MHLMTFVSALLLQGVLAIPAWKHFKTRDEASAVALLSGYTDDNCNGSPFGDFVLDFEPSGEGKCVGNGTVAMAVGVEKLNPACIVNAYTLANCSGEVYHLAKVGCWIDFMVNGTDVGVQGVSVTCSDSAAASASASASAMPSDMAKW